jgi:cytochrome c-type biogenesis protein CcmH/NrfG
MARWVRVVAAFTLAMACGLEALAQMGIARGKVEDEKGGPVEGAVVELVFRGEMERQYKTKTNKKGEYTQVVPSGAYRVTASKEGYQGSFMDQRIATGDGTDLPTLKIVSRAAVAKEAMAPILAQFEKAAALSKEGKTDEAIAIYREVEAQHPDISEVHYNMGTLYARQQKWPEAEAAYKRAVEIAPDNVQAHVLLADVYRQSGRTDEAVATLEKLVAGKPDDPKLHYEMGVMYQGARRFEEAAAQFEEVRKRDPQNVDALFALGTVSLNLGRIDQAKEHLQSYLDKAPADAPYRATATELLAKLQAAKPASP